MPSTLLVPVASTHAVAAPSSTRSEPASNLTWPKFGASAVGAVGFDGVLASSGDTAPRSIASISKIILALTVLDAHPLRLGEAGPSIIFTTADAALVEKYRALQGTTEPVSPGSLLSQKELLQVVLVASANNYAESLAGWAFGSQEGYVAAATGWLAEHGFDQTRVVEPTGISPQNQSTPTDLVGIGKLALANPVIATIVGSKTVTLPGIGTIRNSNRLLGTDRVDGIKTGTLPEAGACLLFSADYPVGSTTVTVIGVMLGGVDHDSLDANIRSLLAGVATGFHEVPLATKGEVFATYSTPWGATSAAVAAADASTVVWSDTPVVEAVRARDVGAADRGDSSGIVSFTTGGARVEIPLVLATSIDPPSAWWRLTHPHNLLRN